MSLCFVASLPSQRRHRKPTLRCAATPPRRKGAVARDLREAMQAALQARNSRIDLVLPPTAALGTEVIPKDASLETRRQAADRELARIVLALFEATGLRVRAVFSTDSALREASRVWGPVEADCVAWQRRGRKPAGKLGFGAAAANQSGDDDVDVFVLVGGGAAFLSGAKKLAEHLGPDKLVILANANSSQDNLPIDLVKYRDDSFESVYHYMPNPHPKWSGGVLFRKFPHEWVLGRITPIGTLQKLIVKSDKPSLHEIGEALGKEGAKADNALLNKISGFMNQDSR